jgi:nitroreductase
MDLKRDRRNLLKLGATIGTGLVLGGTSLAENAQTQTDDLTIFDVFKKRRSVRKFKATPIPEEHITKILDAAHLAPTGGNAQLWKFLVIRDIKKLYEIKERLINERIPELLEWYKGQKDVDPNELDAKYEELKVHFENYLSAPVYIIVLVDNRKGPEYTNRYSMKDGALAAGYLMLAARALGYGTVFCTDTIPEKLTKEIFNIPDHFTRICITPVGVPQSWPETPPKKSLDELVVYEMFK